jgi:hypothetical protein
MVSAKMAQNLETAVADISDASLRVECIAAYNN